MAVTTLFGRRVLLRPLEPGDFAKWQEVRRRNRDWLTKWEPQRLPGQPDVVEDAHAFSTRCSARRASVSSAPATASACSSRACSPVRSTSTRSNGGRSRTPTSVTGLTRPRREMAMYPKRSWSCCVSVSRNSDSIACRRRSCRAIRRAVELPRSSVFATRARRRTISRSTESGKTMSATPSRPRTGLSAARNSPSTGSA